MFDERFDFVLVGEPVEHELGVHVIRVGVEPLASFSHVLEHCTPLFLFCDGFGLGFRRRAMLVDRPIFTNRLLRNSQVIKYTPEFDKVQASGVVAVWAVCDERVAISSLRLLRQSFAGSVQYSSRCRLRALANVL